MTTFGRRGGIFGLSPIFTRLVADEFEADEAQFNGDVRIANDLTVDGMLTLNGGSIGGLVLQGTWNADTNVPDLTAITPQNNHFWIVSDAGSTTLGPISSWAVNDWALYINDGWTKISAGDRTVYETIDIGDMTLNDSNITVNAPATNLTLTPGTGGGVLIPGTMVATTATVTNAIINGTATISGATSAQALTSTGITVSGNVDATGSIESDILVATPNIAGTSGTGTGALSISTGGSTTVRITESKNVGINVAAPTSGLQVTGTIDASPGANGVHIGGGNFAVVRMAGASGSFVDFQNADGSSEYSGRIVYTHNDNGMKFHTNASEKMRLTSAGALGIGVTGPAYMLDIASNETNNGYSTRIRSNATAGTARIQFSNSSGSQQNAFMETGDNRYMAFGTTTEVFRFTPNKDVGIGTTSPSSRFHVREEDDDDGDIEAIIDAGTPSTNLAGNNSTLTMISRGKSALGAVLSQTAQIECIGRGGLGAIMTFKTEDTSLQNEERARFNESGAFIVGGTTQYNGAALNVGTAGIGMGNSGTLGQFRRNFMDSGNNLIWTSGANSPQLSAAGAWTDASDGSYKRDIEDLDYGMETIKKLKPRSYHMKDNEADDNPQIGFVAQELMDVVPEAVSGEEGNLGIGYGRLTAILVNAMQEMNERMERLENSVQGKAA